MTIFFPDVSDFQEGESLAGATAVIAKATENTGWTGVTFPGFRAQAAKLGIPFLAYHFLRPGNILAQVDHCISVVGTGQPLMLDIETESGFWPSLAEVLQFATQYAQRSSGGRVVLAYIPEWFWRGEWGSPSLASVAAAGMALISSDYQAYSDTGLGWQPYGGMTPAVWQYTDAQQFNGRAVDFNAFKGTVDELRALFNGGEDMLTTDQANALDDILTIQVAIALGKDEVNGLHNHSGMMDLSQYWARIAQEVAKNPAAEAEPTAAEIAKAVNEDAAARLAQ